MFPPKVPPQTANTSKSVNVPQSIHPPIPQLTTVPPFTNVSRYKDKTKQQAILSVYIAK
jgi:hypothetical protein